MNHAQTMNNYFIFKLDYLIKLHVVGFDSVFRLIEDITLALENIKKHKNSNTSKYYQMVYILIL